jgi:DNA-binding HxlR family transcriptional regulator
VTSVRADPRRRAGRALDPEQCSIVATLEALGDVWSVLVLRELFFGVRRFNDIQHGLGISRSVLTSRLDRLVDIGLIRTVPYREPGQRVRHEYRLTRKGVGLLKLMVALMEWGDEHVNAGAVPVGLFHKETGARVRLELRTDSGPVEAHQIEPRELDQP